MSWSTELRSWASPEALAVAAPPVIGQEAPRTPVFEVPHPGTGAAVITFLRHCGCPFAEKTFQCMRDAANRHRDINFIAVSHSDRDSTDRWIAAVGGRGHVQIAVDPKRESYAAWGLNVSSFWHVLSPWSLFSVYQLGSREGIWNRPTESGTRWQSSGTFAVDSEGIVRWAGPATSADDIPAFEEVLEALGGIRRE
ncbi:hypothetical protein BU24DRAFT_435749 [Aaosphaeria arxii CBS 175.79]|uniref:Thioredoxin domain-containing protein n=1 Tax=Aaosphaeria arxii CBS 175.79 TaxID=1450172 RepID=A0A6A5XHP4_9PLEO|nr:uncharacterized protein BU24DRAFT_435749 [Aaosphaeria arxii CBS 175.79]KAF2012399.1 hypothetical protein BU24DRAFT_435749 [Aaosphaeria arxii CBS 175.79]